MNVPPTEVIVSLVWDDWLPKDSVTNHVPTMLTNLVAGSFSFDAAAVSASDVAVELDFCVGLSAAVNELLILNSMHGV